MAQFGQGKRGEDAFAAALARGGSVSAAARRAGISRRTATRRLAEVGFKDNVCELRRQFVERAIGRAAWISRKAVAKLQKLLDSPNELVALGAARSLHKMAVDSYVNIELASKLERLTRQVDQLVADSARGYSPIVSKTGSDHAN